MTSSWWGMTRMRLAGAAASVTRHGRRSNRSSDLQTRFLRILGYHFRMSRDQKPLYRPEQVHEVNFCNLMCLKPSDPPPSVTSSPRSTARLSGPKNEVERRMPKHAPLPGGGRESRDRERTIIR